MLTNALASDVSLFFGEELVGSRRVSVGPTNTASLVFVASQQPLTACFACS